jgi:WD40 repeat protein
VLCAGRTRYASETLLVDYDHHSQIRVSEPGGAFGRVFLFDRGDDTGRPVSDLTHAALSPGDRWLALATREVSVFDLEGDDTVRLAQRIPIVASALAFLGDGSLLLGRSDGRLHRFLRDGDALPVETIRGSPAGAAPITALAAVGAQVAIATADGQIYTWAPGDATATQLAGPAAVASRLALSPDGRRLAAACEDDIVRVFDLPSRSLVARLYHLEAGWAAVRADGKYDHGGDVSRLAVASQMRTYRLADLDEMIPDGRIRRAEGAVATSTRPQGDEGPRRAENAAAAVVQGTEG